MGNDQRGGGGVGSGKKDPLLRPFSSSSSCGVISDACHWPLDSSPHVLSEKHQYYQVCGSAKHSENPGQRSRKDPQQYPHCAVPASRRSRVISLQHPRGCCIHPSRDGTSFIDAVEWSDAGNYNNNAGRRSSDFFAPCEPSFNSSAISFSLPSQHLRRHRRRVLSSSLVDHPRHFEWQIFSLEERLPLSTNNIACVPSRFSPAVVLDTLPSRDSPPIERSDNSCAAEVSTVSHEDIGSDTKNKTALFDSRQSNESTRASDSRSKCQTGDILELPTPPSNDSSKSFEVVHYPYLPEKRVKPSSTSSRNRSRSTADDVVDGSKPSHRLGNFVVSDSKSSRWTFP